MDAGAEAQRGAIAAVARAGCGLEYERHGREGVRERRRRFARRDNFPERVICLAEHPAEKRGRRAARGEGRRSVDR